MPGNPDDPQEAYVSLFVQIGYDFFKKWENIFIELFCLCYYSVQGAFINQPVHVEMYNGNNMPTNHYIESGQVMQV